MKKVTIILAAIIGLSMNLFADNEPTREEWRNMSREERKAYREKKLAENHAITGAILQSKAWVLEANTLQDRYGETYQISSTLNFIGIAEENVTVQLGSNYDIGYNGVGGVTVDSRVSDYEVIEGKRKNSGYTVTLSLMSAVMGSSRIVIHVSPEGTASATLTTMEGDRITYNGSIVHLSQSIVYKGTTLY